MSCRFGTSVIVQMKNQPPRPAQMLTIQRLNQSDKSKFSLSPRSTTSSPPSLVFLLPHTCHGDPSPGAGTRCSGSSLRALGGCLCFHRYTGVSASRCHIQGLQQRLQNCSQLKKKIKLPAIWKKTFFFFLLYYFIFNCTLLDKDRVFYKEPKSSIKWKFKMLL